METFELMIDDLITSDLMVDAVALVEDPAISAGWMAFKKDLSIGDKVTIKPGKEHMPEHAGVVYVISEINQGAYALKTPAGEVHKWYIADEIIKSTSVQKFEIINEDEQIVIGPAMIPGLKIFRRDDDGKEYNVTFSAATVKSIAIKFFARGFQKSANIEHDRSQKREDIIFFFSAIKDSKRGVIVFDDNYPDGTWYLGAKITSKDGWGKVKSKEVTGWSVEGMFKYKSKANITEEEAMEKIKEILSRIND